jgi:hypothetical protein
LLFFGGLNSLGGIPNLPWQGYARWERENPGRKRLGPWEKNRKKMTFDAFRKEKEG